MQTRKNMFWFLNTLIVFLKRGVSLGLICSSRSYFIYAVLFALHYIHCGFFILVGSVIPSILHKTGLVWICLQKMGAGELADVSAGGGGCMVGAAVTQKCFRCLPCTVLSPYQTPARLETPRNSSEDSYWNRLPLGKVST